MTKRPDDDVVQLEFDHGVATLTLNRPDRYNAMNPAMARALRALVAEVGVADAVRVLVIRGAGAGFCAGGDIAFVAEHLDALEPAVRDFLADFDTFLTALRDMPKIVLTSVHGAAAGAGFSLAMMGDLCVAADDASFVPAYAKLGVSPDCGGTIGVVRAVGVRRAMQIFLLEDRIEAQRAEALGLVNHVVAAADLRRATAEITARIAGMAPEAVLATKRLLLQSPTTPFDGQLQAEMHALLGCMSTDRYRAAIASFLKA